MLFLGIDPGQSGGLAILNPNFVDPTVIPFKDLTDRDTALAFEVCNYPDVVGMIENVHSFPGQGVASSFKFGMHFGFLRGLLAASDASYEFVSPQSWQKAMGCLTKGDKNVSKAAAQRLFPSVKVTHAIADALLIAEHCRRTWNSRNSSQPVTSKGGDDGLLRTV